ncbi:MULTISPECIES: homocysteine S-methyltransferase [Lactobacillus]|uniref:Homocysteine S-methyltransferase n=1 Tax=Lactobacillus xujianguonis TaxID=2495899 RepID=A0A437SUB1_9LACO|nr:MULTISPECIES: homocysteine S-methyltransferase [Lactobacillus]RVU70407.1 homocysteine S-methyltransferase [Lactobacillus xujianguonis]RVU73654.1 homocysteine S-methyltransferase [Lactobacillus xujianguonis]
MSLRDLAKKGIVLDGAMSDELEKQGVETNNKLWTATALIDQLDKVYKAHTDYFEAGAELVITDTYQANVQAFISAGYSRKDANQFISNAVTIAQKARDDFEKKTGKHNLVAATIGAYGAYLANGSEYRGDYDLAQSDYVDFHLPRLKLVLAQKPDLLAIETQPKLDEPVALLDWLQENQPDIPVYVSFTLKDTQHLSDGTSIEEAAQKIATYPQVFAIGMNCVSPKLVTPALQEFQKATDLPLVVYPNLGASYDPTIKQWRAFKDKFDFNQLTKEWYQNGARLIGGCCTTGPKEIKEISTTLRKIREE